VYDGNGLRVEKFHISSGTCAAPQGQVVDALYWRAVTGQAIAETDGSGNLQNEYVFFNGQRIAQRAASGSVHYYYTDQVGSTTVLTDGSGNPCYQATFTPYGQEFATQDTCTQNYKFTGYERDAETGLDYAFARYYDSRLGCFLSADPLGGDVSDPQSLNRYAYVENRGATFTDPSGGLIYPCSIYENCSAIGTGSDPLYSWIGIPIVLGFGEFMMGVNGDNDLYMVNVYGYFITGVNGSCVIWPAVCEARRKVLAILSAKNPCSTFFNNSPYLLLSKFFSGDSETAADVFASDQIDTYSGPAFITQQGGTLSDPVIANTTQGTGSDSQINVNQNGGFFKGSAFISVDGTVTTETGFLTVGGPSTYAGGTLGAQVTALLHEFAHNVGAIPPDAGNGAQSVANTKSILANCKGAIDAAGQ
jgi:RHS repeat-associated protein